MLTDFKVKNLKPKGARQRIADHSGLYIEVMPSGSKIWLLRFKEPGGKRSWKTLGSYPSMTLSEAREQVILIERQGPENYFKDSLSNVPTFETVGREFCNR